MKILLLAGGSGTRLWPLSRAKYPKQLLELTGGKRTLLQATYARLRKGFAARDIFISIGARQKNLVRAQLPKVPLSQYLVEPEAKNTAAAIAFAATHFSADDPQTIFATANADHFVARELVYLKTLKAAEQAVRRYPDHLVLLGIAPTYAETGYGYIERGTLLSRVGGFPVYHVKRFIEKPPLEKAQGFLKTGRHYWNPAWFVWRADTLLKLYAKHLPDMARAFASGGDLRKIFQRISPVSIDYGILEKTKKLLLIPIEVGWADIGHWRTVDEVLRRRKGHGPVHNLVHQGKCVALDSSGNFISAPAGKLVATLGLQDTVVIDTGDVLLICPKHRAQEVRKIVAEVGKRGLKKFL